MDIPEAAYVALGSTTLGAALSLIIQRAVARVSANHSVKATEAAGVLSDIACLRKAIAVLEVDNALLKKDVLPLSLAVQQWAVTKLTHNHTPEMDALLSRVGDLNEHEMGRLDSLLQERVVEYDDPQIDAVERIAASMLLSVISWVKETEKILEVTPDTQLVSTPKEPEEPEPEKGVQ